MADWRQIQARIRKAKTSSDPSAKLSELYQRTRDAMVAWELGAIEEKAGRTDETVKWYTIAAQRFRRADWKKKAEEALARLGVALPLAEPAAKSAAAEQHADEAPEEVHSDLRPVAAAPALGEIIEDESGAEISPQQSAVSESVEGEKKKRRRGRRGGRGRRRKGAAAAPSLPTQAFVEPSAPTAPAREVRASASQTIVSERRPERRDPPRHIERVEQAVPQLPSERTAHGRAGDPALASRMAHLESMLRRLLSSPLHHVDQLDEAPAGPGVFLLSDSDQVTSYYIESCQTLRIGVGNLIRGGRNRSTNRTGSRNVSEGDLKEKLAEHLGINESKVSQYMKDHCVIRWIQLDDDAPHLAHFAIGVLRTPLNIE
jgi:hypothetical protein